MNESIRKYFKTGVVAFMSYPSMLRGDDPNALEYLRKITCDDYFDAIEVTWIKDDAIRKEASNLLKSSHMAVCYGAQPRLLTTGLNANAIDEAERQKAENTLLEAIDEAYELGASGISFLSGKWEKSEYSRAYASLLNTTRNLCDYAKKKNMSVELEVFD